MEVFAPQGSKVQYTLTGASSQILSIAMKTGDVVHSEPGTMMMMSDDIQTGASCKLLLVSVCAMLINII